MNCDWQELTLADIADPKGGLVDGPFGSNLPASCYVEEGVPVIRGSNLTVGLERFRSNDFVYVSNEILYRLRRSECLPDDIIFTKKGTLGQTGIVPHDSRHDRYLLSSNQMRLRVNKNLADPEYVYYWVSSKTSIEKIKQDSEFTGVPKINLDYLKKFPILIPNLTVQKEISTILSDFDNKIELNCHMNITLKKIAQSLFIHWFVDFEFPDENGTPYRSSGGRMVDSELGETPEGWKVKQIGDICQTLGGGTPKTSEPSYWERGEIFWATPTDMTSLNSPVIFDTARKITEKGLQNSSAKLLPVGSILMTSRATLGYFALTKVPISTNQGFISMICDNIVSNYYLLNVIKNKMDEIENLAGGSTYPEINKTTFRSIKIILPTKNMMKKFDEIADSIYEKIFQNELEIKKLTEIRDSLLPKLMSGKIRVNL